MKKYNIGITFGSFELLHIGHLNLIKQAKKLCDVLIVCIKDDLCILKDKGHPSVMPLKFRKELIEALIYVDKAIILKINDKRLNLIKKYNIDVIFVGDDYTPQTFKGEGLGVPVVYLDRTKGISSTQLRNRYFK